MDVGAPGVGVGVTPDASTMPEMTPWRKPPSPGHAWITLWRSALVPVPGVTTGPVNGGTSAVVRSMNAPPRSAVRWKSAVRVLPK